MVAEKDLKKNMAFNAINGLFNILFPLISFPYVSRVLDVYALGAYNYSNSIINYLLIISGLGVSGYAVRTGSSKKNNVKELSEFVSEIFSISIMTSFIAYIILFTCILLFYDSLLPYKYLLLTQSVFIMSQAIGINWIYNIFEDFGFVTLKNAVINVISIVLMFLLVNEPNDIYIYAFICASIGLLSSFINLFYAKKRCKIRFTLNNHYKLHLRPIVYFWATSLSVTIYVNSDITILGVLTGDYYVGLYSVSTKIYSVLKNLLAAAITVAIPRMSMYYSSNNSIKMNETANEVYGVIITTVLPVITGISIFNKEIILLISGSKYIDASMSLVLLGVCILFYLFSYFYGQCVLVPVGKENIVFWSTLLSAAVNIVLNFLLIPHFKQNAAAFTSILGEGIAMIIAMRFAKKYISIANKLNVIIKTLIGCSIIAVISLMVKKNVNDLLMALLVSIVISSLMYLIIEIVLKNEAIYSVTSKLKKRRGGKN